MLPKEGAAVAEAKHVGFADILVHSPRARGEVREGVRIPGMAIVILRKGEWARRTTRLDVLDDPQRHRRIGKMRLEFRLRMLPPAPPAEHVGISRQRRSRARSAIAAGRKR
jgi:hypothetical protein